MSDVAFVSDVSKNQLIVSNELDDPLNCSVTMFTYSRRVSGVLSVEVIGGRVQLEKS